MVWAEVVESKRQAEKYIDDILEEFEGCFVSPSDSRFLNEQRGYAEKYPPPGKPSDEIPPLSFSKDDQRTISKVVSHARYFKGHNEVRYNINDFFLKPEDVRNLLVKYSGDPLISESSQEYIQSFLKQFNQGFNFSAKQIIVIENITNYCAEFDRHQNLGVIRLGPGKDIAYMGFVLKFARRAVNYGLGKGKKSDEISTDDLLEFRQRFVTSTGVDLSSLRDEIEQTTPEQRTFEKYDNALSLLQDYLNLADPAKYNYNGIHYGQIACARPKILK